MCDKCDLVDKALHGGLAELSEIYEKPIRLVVNAGFFIIIDNPTADGYMGIDRTHGRGEDELSKLPLLLRERMADIAETQFPNHYLDYRPKAAMGHFCFYIRPKKGKPKKPIEEHDEAATKKVLRGEKE